MIVLRCTGALQKRLGQKPDPQPPASTAALGDWYAKPVRVEGGELIVLMSGVTLLSVAVPIEYLPDLYRRFPRRVEELLRNLDVPDTAAQAELSHYDEIVVAKTDSRRQLGFLNEMAHNYGYYVENQIDRGQFVLLEEAERRIAKIPFGGPDYVWPDKATRTLLGG